MIKYFMFTERSATLCLKNTNSQKLSLSETIINTNQISKSEALSSESVTAQIDT